MEERLFPHLLANEPSVIELNEKEYYAYRNIEQPGGSGENAEDVQSVFLEVTEPQDGEVFSGENTKKEIIAEITRRGTTLTQSELGRKNKSELLDLL